MDIAVFANSFLRRKISFLQQYHMLLDHMVDGLPEVKILESKCVLYNLVMNTFPY